MQPGTSAESASLLDHCTRAVERSLTSGAHGLPLIGSGDWNDGMNRVGHLGRGESVWLGWFLYAVLKQLAPLCDRALAILKQIKPADDAPNAAKQFVFPGGKAGRPLSNCKRIGRKAWPACWRP